MLQPNTFDAAKISQNNWQQGAGLLINPTIEVYVRTQDNSKLRLKDGLYIVLSQNCDIVNNCLEKEPVIEIIEANQIEQCNPEVTSGKNPRLLHLAVENENSILEFVPYKRYFISRHYLATISVSDIVIKRQQLKILTRWIVKRTV